MGLTLLSQSTFPFKFLDHAFHTTAYLINKLPTTNNPHSIRYFTLFHKELDYQFLHTFGCANGKLFISKDVIFDEHNFPFMFSRPVTSLHHSTFVLFL